MALAGLMLVSLAVEEEQPELVRSGSTAEIAGGCPERRLWPYAIFELPRFSAETGWPTDADQRLIRIGYGKFIHPPRLVFRRLLKFAGRGVNILEVEI